MDLPQVPLKRADKITMAILATLALAVFGVVGFVALPYLIAAAENTIIFGAEIIVLVVLAMVFLDKNTWATIYYKWKNISRNMRKAVVREDPIGVLNTVINRFESKLNEIDENMANAVAARKKQENAIAQAQASANQEYSLAETARRLQKSDREIGLHATNAERAEKTAESIKPMQKMMADLCVKLEGARDLCQTQIDDAKNQKQMMAIKLGALQEGQKAVKGFKRFFGNNPDLEMQDLAVEEIERQANQAEAEIDEFTRVITPALETADLKKQAEVQQAMDKFNARLSARQPVAAIPSTTGPTLVAVPKEKAQ